MRRFSVSALAKLVGVGTDTIRYYEKAGLLPAPERTAADYRSYDESAVDRLRFIQGGQRLGLRLREIKTLLEVRDTGECPCEPAEQLLRHHIGEVDRELARLRGLRRELVAMFDGSSRPGLSGPGTGHLAATNSGERRWAVMRAPSYLCPCCEDPRCDGSCCGGCR